MGKKHLQRKIIQTTDGSHTVHIPALNENYHSQHGAMQESQHVFIKMGLAEFAAHDSVHIFEVGFGTGLNALLALQFAQNHNINIYFETVDKYPLYLEEYQQLNYGLVCGPPYDLLFLRMHELPWNERVVLSDFFTLKKRDADMEYLELENTFQVIFFDAFAPDKQPNLWTVEIFKKMFAALVSGGVLVTYSAKGQVRRNMIEAGFRVEKLAGPPGKRQMLRAIKS